MSEILEKLKASLAGTYDVQRELGEGGMATVYLANDPKHGRDVAIKVLKPDLAASIGGDRFLREIQIAAKLRHPNILPLYDSGDADGLLYYVMPFVEGEAVRDRLDREQQLPIRDAVRIAREVADALSYAHQQGVVHRDIKPENVLLESGHAVVADFGIGRAMSAASEENITQTGMSVGTPSYMSPEQISGDPQLDGRADIYSLGCMLYEMLVGSPPFTGPNVQAVMARHAMEAVPKPSIVRDTIPDDLENVVLCALAKSKADRFQNAAQFSEALDDIDFYTMTHRFTAAMPGAPPVPVKKKSKAPLYAGIGGAAAVAVAVGAWLALGGGGSGGGGLDVEGFDPRRVAVLYFDDLSSDGELAYVAEGLTEGLIDELGRVRTLDVISRNGVGQFRGTDATRDSVARALEVGSLVEGSVENVGDRLRVVARLVDGNSGADFDRASIEVPVGEFLAARDSVAADISELLRRRLGEEIRLRESRSETRSVEAWSLLQRGVRAQKDGKERLDRNESDAAGRAYQLADSLFAATEAVDPSWVEPIVKRGWLSIDVAILTLRTLGDFQRGTEMARAAGEHADRALVLDQGFPEALELRGASKYATWFFSPPEDADEAEALLLSAQDDLLAAVEGNPRLATAYSRLSLVENALGDELTANLHALQAYEEDAYLENAEQLVYRLYSFSYESENFTQAKRWCDEGRRRFPLREEFLNCQLWLFTTRVVEPDPGRGWALLDSLEAVTPEQAWEYTRREGAMLVAAALARADLADSARSVLLGARAGADVDPERALWEHEAMVRVILGDREEALQLLKQFFAFNPAYRARANEDTFWWWRPIENDPEYQALLRSGG